AAHHLVLDVRLRLVDGRGAGVQWRRRHRDPDLDQPGVLLDAADPAGLVARAAPGLGLGRRVLGGVLLGNRGGPVHAVAVQPRSLEDGAGLAAGKPYTISTMRAARDRTLASSRPSSSSSCTIRASAANCSGGNDGNGAQASIASTSARRGGDRVALGSP